MWPFGPKVIRCPAGVWTVLLSNAFVQMPRSWVITFEPESGGVVAGEWEIRKTAWVFPTAPERGVLLPQMVFDRGWFNTFFKLRVRPVANTIARFQ